MRKGGSPPLLHARGGGSTGTTVSLKTASTRMTYHLRGHHALRFKVEGAESGSARPGGQMRGGAVSAPTGTGRGREGESLGSGTHPDVSMEESQECAVPSTAKQNTPASIPAPPNLQRSRKPGGRPSGMRPFQPRPFQPRSSPQVC